MNRFAGAGDPLTPDAFEALSLPGGLIRFVNLQAETDWIGLPEVEMFADPECTIKLPCPMPRAYHGKDASPVLEYASFWVPNAPNTIKDHPSTPNARKP